MLLGMIDRSNSPPEPRGGHYTVSGPIITPAGSVVGRGAHGGTDVHWQLARRFIHKSGRQLCARSDRRARTRDFLPF